MVADLLFNLLFIIGIIGAVLSLVLSSKPNLSIYIGFIAAIVSAVLGVVVALIVLFDQGFSISYFTTNFGYFGVSVDKLSAFFILIISLLTVPVSIFSLDYVEEYKHEYNVGYMAFLYNLFFLSMIGVVAANNAIMFLVLWELMSLVSYLLVIYENKKQENVSAGNLYVIMTHLGTAFMIIAFLIIASKAGSFEFALFANIGETLPDNLRNGLFMMFLIGFGTKAGIMPLHAWLPYAHPAAPSNISSLMSGVMIKTALMMLIRVIFQFLGVKAAWWGFLLIIVGCVSALLGVMYATVEKDLKRMLAFSSVENIGILFIGLGTAVVYQSQGLYELAALALVATLFHALNHSLFKGLLFLGAGSILYSAHTKNIEDLGGLIKKMPQTSIFFFIACLSISAIPPFNGFVSEWLLVQSMLLSFKAADMTVKILYPLALGVIALVGGFAIACFGRAFGIGFLAMPRTKHSEEAKEVPITMRIGMGILAVLCILTGVLSTFILPTIDAVSGSITGTAVAEKITNGVVIFPVASDFVAASPLVIALLALILMPIIFWAVNKIGGKQPVIIADSWDCGTPINARNEYTGTAFAMPINRFFAGIYRPSTQITTVASASPYIFKTMNVETQTKEPVFENYLYMPIVNGVKYLAAKMKPLQNGNMSAYLGYLFAALVVIFIIMG